MNILFSIDFSLASKNAEAYASELSGKFGANVVLYHSFAMPLVDPYAPIYKYQELLEIEKKGSEMKLEAISRDICHENTHCEILADNAPAIEGILKAVEERNIDLIVAGTAGDNAFTKIFGSTVVGLVSESKVPVLAVPPGKRYAPFKKILCAIDSENYTPENFAFLGFLASVFKSEIIFVHILSDTQSKNNEDYYHVQDEIYKTIGYDKIRFEEFYYRDIHEGLELLCKSYEPDLLCLIKYGRGFFNEIFHRSLTKKFLYHSSVPLLILQE
ncbi:MAG: universal stress protein [Cytophagaceae bacterium]